ncbi:Peptidase family U32 [Lachnospiraceae bacterium XBB1006]|nr:Peptidase family U32 [Lachnospiraceae bacterium XBB1006]
MSDSDKANFEEYIKIAKENGISVSYTANASFNRSIDEYVCKKNEICDILKYLESVGVDSIIVANPLLVEMVEEYTNLKIKISTIQGINRPSAIKF